RAARERERAAQEREQQLQEQAEAQQRRLERRLRQLLDIQAQVLRDFDVLALGPLPDDPAERRARLRELLPEYHPTHVVEAEPGRPDRFFAGTGAVYANILEAALPPFIPANPLRPSLLLFNDEYRLIGCGYTRQRLPGDDGHPPHGLDVDDDEWFFHVAGLHLPNGSFAPMSLEEAAQSGEEGVWHPEVWDLHIFFAADGAPVVGMAHEALSPFSDVATALLGVGTPNHRAGLPGEEPAIYRYQDGVQWQ
ncbi:MAG: hypothetical protein AB2A00_27280, partial [Myxococcota bacterium]